MQQRCTKSYYGRISPTLRMQEGHIVERSEFLSQGDLHLSPISSFLCCVTSGKSYGLSESYLQNGIITLTVKSVTNEIICAHCETKWIFNKSWPFLLLDKFQHIIQCLPWRGPGGGGTRCSSDHQDSNKDPKSWVF